MSGILSGDRVLERTALGERITLAAKALHAAGVAPGEAVALLLRNDFALIEASVAAQTIGAYATPINWHNTPDEIGYILRDCGAKVLVGHDDLLAKLGDAVPPGVLVRWRRRPSLPPPTMWPPARRSRIVATGTNGLPPRPTLRPRRRRRRPAR